MSFLDPYDKDSRFPLLWRMRLVALGALVLAALAAWAVVRWLSG